MRRPRQLASQVLLLQIVVVAATVLAGTFISVGLVNRQVEEEYEQRALAIGHAVAATPDVVEAFGDPDPAAAIQPIADATVGQPIKQPVATHVRLPSYSTGPDEVQVVIGAQQDYEPTVVANSDGIRYSHPNTELIGQRVSTDPTPALAGQAYVGIQQGTLGRSVRAKVPIFDSGGHVIGLVSVGFLEDQVNATVLQSMPIIGANVLLAIALGIAGSALLARRLKRQTFGLAPNEIPALLEQRESMLHGIREGVLTTDRAGRITLVNDEARRLLGLDASAEGRTIADAFPPGRIRDVLAGDLSGPDQMLLALNFPR